jgi:hypothetical protein
MAISPSKELFSLAVAALVLICIPGCTDLTFKTAPIGAGTRDDPAPIHDALRVDFISQMGRQPDFGNSKYGYNQTPGLCMAACLEMWHRWEMRGRLTMPKADYDYQMYIANPFTDSSFYIGVHEKDPKYRTKYQIWDSLLPNAPESITSKFPDWPINMWLHKGTMVSYEVFVELNQDLFGNADIVSNYFKYNDLMRQIRCGIYFYAGKLRYLSETSSRPGIVGVGGNFYDAPVKKSGHAVLVTGMNWDFTADRPIRIAFIDPADELDNPKKDNSNYNDFWYDSGKQRTDKPYSKAILSDGFQKWAEAFKISIFGATTFGFVTSNPVQADGVIVDSSGLYANNADVDPDVRFVAHNLQFGAK